MVCSLPPEMLDVVVDHLYDQPTTLRACCLVSKSWVPRSRIHLFAHVEFNASGPSIRLWTAAFPDPFNSPAHYTRILRVINIGFIAGTKNDVTPWIRAFHNVVHLHVETKGWSGPDWASHVPFHGLSPAIRSLHLESPYTQPSIIFELICSFSLLEDLTLLALFPAPPRDEWITPLTFPRLTGSLLLSGSTSPITRRLLDLPNGLYFTKITLVFDYEADFKLATDLVSRCSDTLESLDVTREPEPVTTSFDLVDLSKATKLKYLVFQCNRPTVQWITMALQTVDSKHLQKITLRLSVHIFDYPFDWETIYREWYDLDQPLAQFWTSHSIRPTVIYEKWSIGKDIKHYAPTLLPQLTGRGLVDLVECEL